MKAGAWAAFADGQVQFVRGTSDEAVVAVCFCPASISGRASDEKGVCFMLIAHSLLFSGL